MDEESGTCAVRVNTDQDLAALVALAALPGISPGRIWSLLAASEGAPGEAWDRVVRGDWPASRRSDSNHGWTSWAGDVDPDQMLDEHRRRDVAVYAHGSAGYPQRLIDDPEPPAVVFAQGPGTIDERVAVAVVGTRRCTRQGIETARELGIGLASAGIAVVSGLAGGIDAAAHAGARSVDLASCVGVVGGGLDHVYPRQNRELWRAISGGGLLLSEWALGEAPRAWRFPARNRVVAGLSAAVVVVESPEKGGSLYTVDEALTRDRAVFAVPGSIRSPVARGTNRLIADGAEILWSVEDFVASLAPAVERPPVPEQAVLPIGDESWLLAAIGWEPATSERVIALTGRAPGEVMLEVERQIAAGRLVRTGSLVERIR